MVSTPDELFIILQISKKANYKEDNELQAYTSPYQKLSQQPTFFTKINQSDHSRLYLILSLTLYICLIYMVMHTFYH